MKDGDTATVKASLKAGADVNAKNSDGSTALIAAASKGYAGIVKALLKAGAEE